MLLEARDVTKAFGSFKAVDRASVTLEQGDILGLIVPDWRSALDFGQGFVRRP
jgi:branched-chain amino acid transport system ATP-binding protein